MQSYNSQHGEKWFSACNPSQRGSGQPVCGTSGTQIQIAASALVKGLWPEN